MFRKGGKTYFKGLKKGKGKSRPKTVPKAVKAYVAKQIIRTEEQKSNAYALNNYQMAIYDAGTASLPVYDCRQVLAIAQSAGQGGRIGNQIHVKSCIVYGFITMKPPAVVYANVWMRLVMLRVKEDIVTPNGTLAQLFQFGNNTLPPVGNLLDMIRAFNKDYYTIYASKKILLGSSDNITSVTSLNNSVGSCYFKFDITKVLGGKCIYNDSTTIPTNKACYLMFIPCNANGTVATFANVDPYVATINSEVIYTDA